MTPHPHGTVRVDRKRAHRRRRTAPLFRLVAFGAFGLQGLSSASLAVPGQSAATVVAEEGAGVVVRLAAPHPTWAPTGGYVYPSLPGFGLINEPGRPVLPVRIERVGIPPGSHPRLTILEASPVQLPAGRIGPSQRWVPLLPGSDQRIPVGTEDPTVYGRDALYPSDEPVRLGSIGALREQAFVEIVFTPVLYNPVRRETIGYEHVTVRLDFDVLTPRTAPAVDPSFEDVYEAGLVNAGQARAFRGSEQGGGAGSVALSRDAGLTSTPLSVKYKLTVNKDGVYRLSGAWLAANAPGILSFAPSTYRIDSLGVQVPITVETNGDGTLSGSGDYIEFFGQALAWDVLDPDTWNAGDYTDDNAYWLYADGSGGLRIPALDGYPSHAYAIPPDFVETVHHEVNDRFVQQVPQDPLDHWYQAPPVFAVSNVPHSETFIVDTPGVSTSTASASIKVRLLGDNYIVPPLPSNYHRTTIKVNPSVNPSPVSGPTDWDGFTEFTQGPASFNQSVLNDGSPDTTDVTVSLPLGRTVSGTQIKTDTVFMNWIEITYGRKFKVDANNTLVFSVPNQNAQLQITGLSTGASAIYETTKTLGGTPLADPVRITGARVSVSGTFTAEFEIATNPSLPPGARRRFILAAITSSTATGDLTPAAVRAGTPPDLRNPGTGADWLVLANAGFLDASSSSFWQQLLLRRSAQGMRVRVVDVQDVYDEFSYGIEDPQAIRDFFAYVYANWPRTDPAVPLRYGIMLGDASFDYKNGFGNPQNKNLLSSHLRSISNSSILGWMSDDNYFAAVSGTDDLPDFFLGRWPVHNVAETNAVAEKILAYETSPPGQPWQHDDVFVADDDEANFEQVQDQQISDFLAGTAHTYHRTYEGRIKAANPGWTTDQVAAETRDRILRQLNGTADPARDIGPGAAVVSFVGHGSWQAWGSNAAFLSVASSGPDDLSFVTNPSKLPLVLVADCISGGFTITSSPSASTDLTYSFGEDFLVTGGKGAIAVIAPSHLTYFEGHTLVEQTFFGEAYGPKKTRNFGKLNTAIQLVFAGTGDLIDLRAYTLLGDPAVNLIVPAPAPPTNLSASGGNRQVTVSWTPAPDAASYHVYQAPSSYGPWVQVGTNVATTSFVAGGLTNCSEYYYVLSAVDQGGFEGAWSLYGAACGSSGNCASATPLNTSAPAPPTGVTAVDTEAGGVVRLTWSPNPSTDEVNDYTVYYGTSPGVYDGSQPAGSATSVVIVNLIDGVTYYFAVTGSNCSRGEGLKSAQVAAVPHRVQGIKPPDSIDDLRIYRSPDPGDGVDDTRLTWTPPVKNIYGQPTTLDHQEIYAGTTPIFVADAAHLLASVPGGASSYIHENGFGSKASYYYLVVSVDVNGNRSGVGRELPQGIEGLTLTRSMGNLAFSWPAVTKDLDGRATRIDHYALYGRPAPFRRAEITPALLVSGNIHGTALSLPIPPGSLFCYSVIAVDDKGGNSPW